ncbi:zf-TFIIB domain-containing protein [Paenibacillus sp. GM2]|uniref:TFIIB-type zinc ribbon-containing protein n=1 Tax=Paenibacillus sp. GM2 TaxID=1622070 RepID=UPI0008393199|nr:zf-TFIIB domain-containing protein [Paenibacillus sp. GM2]
MRCPVCDDVRMREIEKDGVMIDVCPECKGVWLDRGELEKLMSEVREIRPAFNEWYDHRDQSQQHTNHSANHGHGYGDPYAGKHNQGYNNKYRKKKSVLDVFGDLFD